MIIFAFWWTLWPPSYNPPPAPVRRGGAGGAAGGDDGAGGGFDGSDKGRKGVGLSEYLPVLRNAPLSHEPKKTRRSNSTAIAAAVFTQGRSREGSRAEQRGAERGSDRSRGDQKEEQTGVEGT